MMPEKPGWYWWTPGYRLGHPPPTEPIIVEVDLYCGALCIVSEGYYEADAVDRAGGTWGDRIEEPPDDA